MSDLEKQIESINGLHTTRRFYAVLLFFHRNILLNCQIYSCIKIQV